MLKFENVSKSVQMNSGEKLQILQNISFSLAPSETVAIVGPSGSGKSTLLALAAGLDKPDSGKIVGAGLELGQAHEKELAFYRSTLISIVFQSFHLFAHLNVLENVQVAALLGGKDTKETQAHALECLQAVGLSKRSGHYPSQLSGGERQRVAIARAICAKPKLLLCDEPTGNLDRNNAEKIFNLIVTLSREHKSTLVVVTHDLSLASQLDQRLELNQGRLV